jgi:hypothetical protein
MIKVFLMLRRQPHLSRSEFIDYWYGQHRLLARQAAGAMQMRRYVQNHPAVHPVADALRAGRGAREADFDGIAEAWWDSFEQLAALGNAADQVAASLMEDERRFVDLARSEMFVAEEHLVVGT